MGPLPTARQLEVLCWIDDFICRHGYAPTHRELSDAFGYSGPYASVRHVEALRKKGLIEPRPAVGLSRTIRPTGRGRRAAALEGFRRAVRQRGMEVVR